MSEPEKAFEQISHRDLMRFYSARNAQQAEEAVRIYCSTTMTVKQVARQIGRPAYKVGEWLQQRGIALDRRRGARARGPIWGPEAREMMFAGRPLREIAERYGVTRQRVYQVREQIKAELDGRDTRGVWP